MAVKDPLVAPGWLADRLGSPELAVIDASWFMPPTDHDAAQEFVNARIPGATFFGIDQICDHHSALPHMLSAPNQFQAAVRDLGVSQRSTVVVYDSQGVTTAPRVWWNFRAMGHGDTYVLDGGLPKWRAEGRPLESGEPDPGMGDFIARPEPSLVRDLAQVRRALERRDEQIIDARATARFRGLAPEPRPGLRSGHMPGAHNLPWADLISAEGVMKPPEALTDAFARAGVDLTGPVITSCGSGITAAVLALALARIGRADVAVYDGSWSEWGSKDDTPVESL